MQTGAGILYESPFHRADPTSRQPVGQSNNPPSGDDPPEYTTYASYIDIKTYLVNNSAKLMPTQSLYHSNLSVPESGQQTEGGAFLHFLFRTGPI